ncbi:hypothetical protein LR48_Vigan07g097500 [Vigna angularis]|uniref:Exocyst subunit Exo70 family protein n=1 Tax=Phaseolus angularis TaxID=3914 RepID=A0A0L9UX14_PHAAN|nr:hypothetical protein LR48_Vigan07g097500 [Vigna angularis]
MDLWVANSRALHGCIDEMEKIQSCLTKVLYVVDSVLLPNERTLCDRVFKGVSSPGDFASTVVCRELNICLVRIANHLATILEYEMISPVLIYRMIELLESSLEANSKNYKNPSLGYVFIMNNRRFIEVETKLNGLGLAFGDDWLHKNTTKFQENLELYLRSSWNKIVDLLKVDINQLEPSVTVELMKDNLYWFNEHFDETCNIQSAWPVCDEELREQIIKSIENMLLPAYGSFLGTFEEFVGKHAYRYIKYGMFEVQDRLNKLFLLRE